MHFSIAFSKNSILGFFHLPIKLDPLNPKMAFRQEGQAGQVGSPGIFRSLSLDGGDSFRSFSWSADQV